MLRSFGRMPFRVPPLGLGAGRLGDTDLDEADVKTLLHRALDLGLRLFDAAPSYGQAEIRLGRHLAGRPDILRSTKVGYGVEGVPDWTGPCIRAGVDQALSRMQAEVLDIVHLHSCPAAVLHQGDVVEALLDARKAGKIRAAAYSGDNHDLAAALALDVFDSVQASFNLCDRANRDTLAQAHARGMGVLAKRPLANAAWRQAGGGGEAYVERWSRLGLPERDEEAAELALRYTVFHGPVDAALLGTRSLTNLERSVAAIDKGPLPSDVIRTLETRWIERAAGWDAVI